MTTTVANDKHYAAVARDHAKTPDAFVGAALKASAGGETAKSAAKPDMVAASGKGVPAKAVASKLVPGLVATKAAKPSAGKGA